jgi:uncharacterized protein
MRLAASFVAGVVFALGLGISGLTHPERIIAFLDVTGAWDPTLAFVMAAAVATHATLSVRIRRRAAPMLAARFTVPTRRDLDAGLLVGSAMFGVGWGLGGFCPGPAIVALVSNTPAVFAFVASMVVGMAAYELSSPLAGRITDTLGGRVGFTIGRGDTDRAA